MKTFKKTRLVTKPVHGGSGGNRFFTFPLVDANTGLSVATLHCAMLQKSLSPSDLGRAFNVFGADLFPLLGAKLVAGRGHRTRGTRAAGDETDGDDGEGGDGPGPGLDSFLPAEEDEEDDPTGEASSLVAVYGYDRPGVLEYTTNLFDLNDVGIASCFGAQLKSKVKNKLGCFFDLTHECSWEQVGVMCEKLLSNDVPPFTVRPLRAFDRVFDLTLEFETDGHGLLVPVAKFLADLGVNLQSFNARPEEFGELPGLPEVKVDTRLELPVGVEAHEVFTGLFSPAVVPPNTFVRLREVRRLQNNKPVKGTLVLEGMTA